MDPRSFIDFLTGSAHSDHEPHQILRPLLNRMGKVLILRGPQSDEAYQEILEAQMKTFFKAHKSAGLEVYLKDFETLTKFLELFMRVFPLESDRSLRRPVDALRDTLSFAIATENLKTSKSEENRCQLSLKGLSDATREASQ
jgi:hypothetical protein